MLNHYLIFWCPLSGDVILQGVNGFGQRFFLRRAVYGERTLHPQSPTTRAQQYLIKPTTGSFQHFLFSFGLQTNKPLDLKTSESVKFSISSRTGLKGRRPHAKAGRCFFHCFYLLERYRIFHYMGVSSLCHLDSKPTHVKQLNLRACCILIAKVFPNNFTINF